MNLELAEQHFDTAMSMANTADADDAEKAAMLAEVSMGLQRQAQHLETLKFSQQLLERALNLASADQLLQARLQIQLAGVLQLFPENVEQGGPEPLQQAANMIQQGITGLQQQRVDGDELAEAEMALGLVLQSLASAGRARMTDAIDAYQRAAQGFPAQSHAAEYAILQNNLASAYLAMSDGSAEQKMREAMAVQAFESALAVVSLEKHPAEYAMLQNNLGNALQYAASGHPIANNLRALDAYDEALKVRQRGNAPVLYANTQANRANCLRNLPDDPQTDDPANTDNLRSAIAVYEECLAIFLQFGEWDKVPLIQEMIEEIQGELQANAETENAVPAGQVTAHAH